MIGQYIGAYGKGTCRTRCKCKKPHDASTRIHTVSDTHRSNSFEGKYFKSADEEIVEEKKVLLGSKSIRTTLI
jgi:hypothetical protein